MAFIIRKMARPFDNIRIGFDEKDPKTKMYAGVVKFVFFLQTKKIAVKLFVSQNQEKYSFY